MAGEQQRRAAVVTVSDGVAAGVRDDASGRAVADALVAAGFEVARREVVPDEADRIAGLLRSLSDEGVALIATTGGTGLGPRDVTPEATRSVIDREAPGLAEEMRGAGRAGTPFAALSRGIAGSRGSTLIVNLPGSERGATESLAAIAAVLPHALDLLAGATAHGPADATNPAPHAHGSSIEEELTRRRAAGENVVMATAVRVQGSPPCRVGMKILVGNKGPVAGTLGCAEFDAAAIGDSPGVLLDARPTMRTYEHELGSVEVYLEPFVRPALLIAFSATPVALHLTRWAPELGFDPVVVESRSERVTPEHRAAARVQSSVEGLSIERDTVAVHTDHDAPGVAESVAALLRSPARFVGVMGSRRHVAPYLQALRDAGLTDEEIGRLRSPVGIDLGARTAEEIALSILAGLVADRRGAEGGWLDRR